METIDKNIAYNLKRIRKGQNMSLDMLAELTGVSKSMLGQIERGESNPTITTVSKICEGLKITIEELVYKEEESLAPVRLSQYRIMKEVPEKYTVRLIFPFDKKRNFEMYMISLEAGSELHTGTIGVRTMEYLTVSAGKVTVCHGKDSTTLEIGDSICLKAGEEYTLQNAGDNQTDLNVIMTVA